MIDFYLLTITDSEAAFIIPSFLACFSQMIVFLRDSTLRSIRKNLKNNGFR